MQNDPAEQRIAIIGTGHRETGGTRPPAGIEHVARAPYRPELIETPLQIFPDTPARRDAAAIGYLEAGYRAESQGYAAVFINTVGDYGLQRMRRALAIPAVGAGQAGMYLAASLADRFAIVTIWPRSMEFIYRGLLDNYGLADRCVAIQFGSEDAALASLAAPDNFVERMRRGEIDMLENLAAHCLAARSAGAGAILLGCTCMSPIADLLAEHSPVPVVDPMTAGYRYTELIVGAGLMPAPLPAGAPAPGRDEVAAALRAISATGAC
jgi:allantoin racemase